jgi:hypothetical protein
MTPDDLSRMTAEEKRALLRRLLAERTAAAAPSAPADASAAFPLSHAQRALWFLQRLVPDTVAYNVALTGRLSPSLDIEAFGRAMNALVARHAALRTVFEERNGQPMQRVLPRAEARVRVVDAHDMSDAELHAAVRADYARPFALDTPLAATTVYRRRHEDVLLINVHHLVFDAWSQQILFTDLRALYEAEQQRRVPRLPAKGAEYHDFVNAQSALLEGGAGDTLRRYWQSVFSAPPRPLAIPPARPRGPDVSMEGATVPFALGPDVSAALHALAKRQNTTLYTVMLAAMQLLLVQFSGESDVTIGTPVSLRSRPEWLGVIGYFINMLPMRTTVREDDTFTAHLARARETVLRALEHQDLPFPLLVDQLKVRRDPSRSPLFQAMLNVIVSPRGNELARLFTARGHDALTLGSSRLTSYVIPQQEGQFEIMLEIMDFEGMLLGNLKYQTALYDAELAQRMTDTFVATLEAIARAPDARVDELNRVERDTFEF